MADKAASACAREEGNTHFRKGRWRDAAAAYLRAGDLDPADAVPWSNRAMAWLKLERWAEAREDATAALARDPANVKALYRRALAYRALGELGAARADLLQVLARESGNGAARAELEEVERAMRVDAEGTEGPVKEAEGAEGTGKEEGGLVKPMDQEMAEPTPSPPPSASAAPNTAAAPPSGFAALRRTRDARPSYAAREAERSAAESGSASPAPSAPAVGVAEPAQQTAEPAPTSARAAPAPAPQVPASASKPFSEPAPAPTGPAPIPPNPRSTAPGAGLALLRALAPLPPAHRWSYLRHYDPGLVGRITAPVLEPDGLALLLSALAAGMPYTEADGAWAREVLDALRGARRWRMNCAMLSRAERACGERAWAAAGGEGAF